jgi:hypothetical protein
MQKITSEMDEIPEGKKQYIKEKDIFETHDLDGEFSEWERS